MFNTATLKGGHVAVFVPNMTGGAITIYEADKVTQGVYQPAKCIEEIDAKGLQKFLNGIKPAGIPVAEELFRLRNLEHGIRDFFNQPMGDPFPSATDLLAWLESTTGFELEPAAPNIPIVQAGQGSWKVSTTAQPDQSQSKEDSSHVQN
jgi:hypothetical protein